MLAVKMKRLKHKRNQYTNTTNCHRNLPLIGKQDTNKILHVLLPSSKLSQKEMFVFMYSIFVSKRYSRALWPTKIDKNSLHNF